MNKNFSDTKDIEQPEGIRPNGNIVTRLHKEDLKSLLYMVAGKPDSSIKLFYDPIVISSADIIELNDAIQEKLKNHEITGCITTVDVTYQDDEIEQYGYWNAFISHKWNTSKRTEGISIKWDFLVQLPQYQIPQRHTVVVKLTDRMSPFDVMQAVFSKDPEDRESVDFSLASVMCRVDCINHILCQELLSIVEEWYEARTKLLIESSILKFLRKHEENMLDAISDLTIFLSVGVSAGIVNYAIDKTSTTPLSPIFFKDLTILLMLCGLLIYIMSKFCNIFRFSIKKLIHQYGRKTMFLFTNGDQNKQREYDNKNKGIIWQLIVNIILPILINILSGILTFNLFQ